MKRRPPAATVQARLTDRDDSVAGELNTTHLVDDAKDRSGTLIVGGDRTVAPSKELEEEWKTPRSSQGKGTTAGRPRGNSDCPPSTESVPGTVKNFLLQMPRPFVRALRQ